MSHLFLSLDKKIKLNLNGLRYLSKQEQNRNNIITSLSGSPDIRQNVSPTLVMMSRDGGGALIQTLSLKSRKADSPIRPSGRSSYRGPQVLDTMSEALFSTTLTCIEIPVFSFKTLPDVF